MIYSLLPSLNYAQWVNTLPGAFSGIFSIYFLNEDTGFALDVEFLLRKTTDSGNTWNQIYHNTYDVDDMTFLNDSVGFVCGDYGRIFKTTNGGFNWSPYDTEPSYYLYALYFINESTGFCAGDRRIYKTTNVGETWIGTVLNLNLYSIQFINSQTGFAAGTVIYKTTNLGLNWNIINNSPVSLYSIYFINEATGFVCGSGGRIYKTTDSGDSWQQQTSNTNAYLYSITFPSIDTGYAVGDNSILKTIDSGANWFSQNSSTFNLNNFVCMLNNTTGFVGGGFNGGYILKTTNGGGEPIGIQSNSTNAPEAFSLSQNFPNPFNPVTKIKFDVPSNVNGQTSNVKLTVYNSLGKIVATLVNEKLNAGSYDVEFNGDNYSSGVYYYKLQTNSFSETKKMLLIR